jgi:hypothetical protein
MVAGPFPKRVCHKPATAEPGRDDRLSRCRDRGVACRRLAWPDLTERPRKTTERACEDRGPDHVERARLTPVPRREGRQHAHSKDRERRIDPEHHCQPKLSVRKPPNTGPAAYDLMYGPAACRKRVSWWCGYNAAADGATALRGHFAACNVRSGSKAEKFAESI